MFRTNHGLATQTRKGKGGAWAGHLARRMLPDALIDFCSRRPTEHGEKQDDVGDETIDELLWELIAER